MFVNGVPQRPGTDYHRVGNELVFDRPLEKERLSKGKWAAIFFGLWGYYGKNDRSTCTSGSGGRDVVATGLGLDDQLPPKGSDPTLTRSC